MYDTNVFDNNNNNNINYWLFKHDKDNIFNTGLDDTVSNRSIHSNDLTIFYYLEIIQILVIHRLLS